MTPLDEDYSFTFEQTDENGISTSQIFQETGNSWVIDISSPDVKIETNEIQSSQSESNQITSIDQIQPINSEIATSVSETTSDLSIAIENPSPESVNEVVVPPTEAETYPYQAPTHLDETRSNYFYFGWNITPRWFVKRQHRLTAVVEWAIRGASFNDDWNNRLNLSYHPV